MLLPFSEKSIVLHLGMLIISNFNPVPVYILNRFIWCIFICINDFIMIFSVGVTILKYLIRSSNFMVKRLITKFQWQLFWGYLFCRTGITDKCSLLLVWTLLSNRVKPDTTFSCYGLIRRMKLQLNYLLQSMYSQNLIFGKFMTKFFAERNWKKNMKENWRKNYRDQLMKYWEKLWNTLLIVNLLVRELLLGKIFNLATWQLEQFIVVL